MSFSSNIESINRISTKKTGTIIITSQKAGQYLSNTVLTKQNRILFSVTDNDKRKIKVVRNFC